MDKADPYAFRMEHPPGTASQIWDLGYDWGDQEWMAGRGRRQSHASPMSIYEVHLGSWQRHPDGRFLSRVRWPTPQGYEAKVEAVRDIVDAGFSHGRGIGETCHLVH